MVNILIAKKDAKNAAQLARLANLQLSVLSAHKLAIQPMLKDLAHLFAEMELLSLDKPVIQEMLLQQVVLPVEFNQIGFVLDSLPLAEMYKQDLPQDLPQVLPQVLLQHHR
jgi:hypothetical protein